MEFKNKLRIFQTIYGVIMALALRTPIQGFFALTRKIYKFHNWDFFSIGFLRDWSYQLLPFAFLVLTLLRFYYAVNNIEFYINKIPGNKDRQRRKIARWVIFDYVVLLFQALLFYFLSEFVIIGGVRENGFFIDQGQMINFFKVYTFILLTNVFWVILLSFRINTLKGSLAQLIWLINNLIFCICFLLVVLNHQTWQTIHLFWIGFGLVGVNTACDLLIVAEHYVYD